jgi:hypothetical protein
VIDRRIGHARPAAGITALAVGTAGRLAGATPIALAELARGATVLADDSIVRDAVPARGVAPLAFQAGAARTRSAIDALTAGVDDTRAFAGTGDRRRLGNAAALPIAIAVAIALLLALAFVGVGAVLVAGLAPPSPVRAAVIVVRGRGVQGVAHERHQPGEERQTQHESRQAAAGADGSATRRQSIESSTIHGKRLQRDATDMRVVLCGAA